MRKKQQPSGIARLARITGFLMMVWSGLGVWVSPAAAGGEEAPDLSDLKAYFGQNGNWLLFDPLFESALHAFVPSAIRSDFLGENALARRKIVDAFNVPRNPEYRALGGGRYLVYVGCRPHACDIIKGALVMDLRTGDLCAVEVAPNYEPDDYHAPLKSLSEHATATISAEVFAPPETPETAALLQHCRDIFSIKTQRIIPNGYFIVRGDIVVRTAPDFRADDVLSKTFDVWDGLPSRY
jgi:hypothetical protein